MTERSVRHMRHERGAALKETGGRMDMRVLVLLILLLMCGLVSLFSASYYTFQDSGDAYAKVRQQLAGIALGTAALTACSRIPYRFYRRPWVILSPVSYTHLTLPTILRV